MKKLMSWCGLITLLPLLAFAGPLDSFVGTYTLEQGTEGMNAQGDLICPSPLIFRLSLSALDSNMPQLPVLQVASLQSNTQKYAGVLSADAATFTYSQVTKTTCAFFGFFCSNSSLEGSLVLTSDQLVLTHSESTSSDGILSSGSCTYTK